LDGIEAAPVFADLAVEAVDDVLVVVHVVLEVFDLLVLECPVVEVVLDHDAFVAGCRYALLSQYQAQLQQLAPVHHAPLKSSV